MGVMVYGPILVFGRADEATTFISSWRGRGMFGTFSLRLGGHDIFRSQRPSSWFLAGRLLVFAVVEGAWINA